LPSSVKTTFAFRFSINLRKKAVSVRLQQGRKTACVCPGGCSNERVSTHAKASGMKWCSRKLKISEIIEGDGDETDAQRFGKDFLGNGVAIDWVRWRRRNDHSSSNYTHQHHHYPCIRNNSQGANNRLCCNSTLFE
jgi:hypothetical protein